VEGKKGKETEDKKEENGNATGENIIEGRGKRKKKCEGGGKDGEKGKARNIGKKGRDKESKETGKEIGGDHR